MPAPIFLLALSPGKAALSDHRAPRTRGRFRSQDTASDKLRKLQVLLATSGHSRTETLRCLPTCCQSRRKACRSIPNLSPQRRKERTFEALIRRLQTLGMERTVLMLAEDMHWADPSSRELFDLTIERIVSPPMLLVMTFRPEFHAPLIGRAGVSLLTLNRLDRRIAGTLGCLAGHTVELIEHCNAD